MHQTSSKTVLNNSSQNMQLMPPPPAQTMQKTFSETYQANPYNIQLPQSHQLEENMQNQQMMQYLQPMPALNK